MAKLRAAQRNKLRRFKMKTLPLAFACLLPFAIPANAQTIYACSAPDGGVKWLSTNSNIKPCPSPNVVLNWNVTGPQGPIGPQGPQGVTGATGANGATPAVGVGTVTTVPNNSDGTVGTPTVTVDPNSTPTDTILDFGIPQGVPGMIGANQYQCVQGATVATNTAAPFYNPFASNPNINMASDTNAPGISTSGSQFTNFTLQPGSYRIDWAFTNIQTWESGANGMVPSLNGTYPISSLQPSNGSAENWTVVLSVTEANSILQLITLVGGTNPPVDGLCSLLITQIQ